MVLIVMGPMGSGKTTVGRILAGLLGWRFIEGDDFHPPANVEKMRAGIPLGDEDRWPWLDALRAEIEACQAGGGNAVIACSALKRAYRERLGVDQERVITVFLRGSRELLQARIAGRVHEYMNAQLLQSQLDTLEPPEGGIVADIGPAPREIAASIARALRER